MKQFSELGIKPVSKAFTGDQVKIKRIIGQPITVLGYKIEPSKYPEKGNGKRLTMQIEFEGKKAVVWTGSVYLQELITQVPESSMPFSTKIIEQDGLLFT